MRSLDLGKLYDSLYDKRPPTILRRGSSHIWVRAANSNKEIRLPTRMNGKLAYLIGVIIGDGYLSKPIRRRSHGPGFHWKIVVTGSHSYIVGLNEIFRVLFCISGGLTKDPRKRDAWQLRFSQVVLHRFFARVIGLPRGRKTKHRRWSDFDMVREYPVHFLSGLIDTDGYVGSHYIGIIQKDFQFLTKLLSFTKETIGISFRGPHVNKKRDGEITSWMISLNKRDERMKLLDAKKNANAGL